MFENIEKIEWDKLICSAGNSEEIPKFLNLLLSNNKQDRIYGMEELIDKIYDQGTIYQVTGYVLPFLIEILNLEDYFENDKVTIKKAIIEIIKITLQAKYSYKNDIPNITVKEVILKEYPNLSKYIKSSNNERFDRLDLLIILSEINELKHDIYLLINEEFKDETDDYYRSVIQNILTK